MYNYKKLIGELLGASIAVVWILFAFLGAGNMMFLAVAISLTILLGVLSGGFIALGNNKIDYKALLGWLFGASIAVVWVSFALLGLLGILLFLGIAIAITIVFGVLSGGFLKLSAKNK